jgi:hypothetical protein
MVRKAVIAGVAALMAASPASAQSGSPPRPVDRVELRHQIYVMEGALARAVEFGAQRLNRELRTVAPDMFLLTGDAQARGVYLEGYGIFFDVEVPMLRESMMWTLRTMLEQDDSRTKSDVASLRRWVQGVQDPSARASLEQALRRLENQALPVFALPRSASAGAGADPLVTAGGLTRAAGAPEAAPAPSSPAPTAPAAVPAPELSGPPPRPSVDQTWLKDPNRAYSESVVRALIDAMIDFSAPMDIANDEFLTVAARDNARRDYLAPQDPYEEVVTVLLRIRGADLREYRAGRIEKEEARKRVKVGEF